MLNYYYDRTITGIYKLIDLYCEEPFRILSESDMKCWLFHFLQDEKEYNVEESFFKSHSDEKETHKRKTYFIHTENHTGDNSWVDLRIFDGEINFRRNKETGHLQAWQWDNYNFDIGIELKYAYNDSKNDVVEKKILKDLSKLQNADFDKKFFIIFDHSGTLHNQVEFDNIVKPYKDVNAIYVDGFHKRVYTYPSKLVRKNEGYKA
jgi:hypothetical protein